MHFELFLFSSPSNFNQFFVFSRFGRVIYLATRSEALPWLQHAPLPYQISKCLRQMETLKDYVVRWRVQSSDSRGANSLKFLWSKSFCGIFRWNNAREPSCTFVVMANVWLLIRFEVLLRFPYYNISKILNI